ncbi:hypothetical protein [Thiomicrospira sp. WB1]|uniref:hypothetical protein n=1 Tax=Thiomicrospira sp. WB1 TaxID=1685380 RepID=UPI0007494D25|nr:hypothetical protein [Thiomicrospira sp. WB1]KUJ71655.1 hypothetical protein AVO41_09075 [Thiomicrospira sp. WB1]
MTSNFKILTLDGKAKDPAELQLGEGLASPDENPNHLISKKLQGPEVLYKLDLIQSKSRHSFPALTERSVILGESHLLRCHSSRWQGEKILTVAEIAKLQEKSYYKNRIALMAPKVDFGPESSLENKLTPYALGVFMNNATYENGCIWLKHLNETVLDKLILSYAIKAERFKKGIRIDPSHLPGQDELINFLENKRFDSPVIQTYLFESTFQERLALLAGLVDASGSVEPRDIERGTLGVSYLHFSDQATMQIVQTLLWSLGTHPRIYCKEAQRKSTKTNTLYFTVSFKFPALREALTVHQKKERANERFRSNNARIGKVTKLKTKANTWFIRTTHPNNNLVTDNFLLI